MRASRLGKLLLVGLTGGVLMAVAALPAAAIVTFALNHSAVAYADLPEALRNPDISQASSLYANDGETLITTFFEEDRHDIPLDQAAKVLQDAVIAAEDSRFYEHHGVDPFGVIRAMVADSSSPRSQGASTLTMQYVRNVLKSDPSRTAEDRKAATAVTPARKIQEIRYAITLEQYLSKRTSSSATSTSPTSVRGRTASTPRAGSTSRRSRRASPSPRRRRSRACCRAPNRPAATSRPRYAARTRSTRW